MEINVAGWFEIPVADMPRAIAFYQAVFDYKMELNNMGEFEMAWFPANYNAPGAAGALVYHKESYKPSMDGSLIYFTSPTGNLQNELDKVEAAGGKLHLPKRLITEDIGYMAVFIDSEGNRVALHSLK
ncbi:VOC family protein [Chitinophaga sp. SYP-B3965]|uniref:VOC family protein n=1 Tax=Chitinophaga sp. SYP-B3965 TaxID=2663120 RepID=UPI0012999519|nr:VOC family protein [Chitinophaga sp. SYP-B3965]MRG44583.1 VOC family protein [Chitinophaga sp. SYP-B3965]